MSQDRSALIVACDQYADPGLRELRAPAHDAMALAAALRNPEIGDFEVKTLLNEPAHVVSLAVEEFFADRRPGDLLLVHFSGHGVKGEDGELYFPASNTTLSRLAATAVPAEFVSRRMSRSRSRRIVLMLDCCYAGAFERGLMGRAGTDMGIKQQFDGRGRAVITASSAMEYAFEGGELPSGQHPSPSVFTSALVEGLETGEADRDQDGLIGLDELYGYVYDKVREATPNQTPGKWTFGVEGELYIARRRRPVTSPSPLPPELRQATESALAGIRAGAVQELARILHGSHAGMALAARLALEQLIDDDSRAVAAAATAALGGPAPAAPPQTRPELVLSATVIDMGRLSQHSRAPERRIRPGNAGDGNLNARASVSASWLKLCEVGDEFLVTIDTSTAGEFEGTITIDSDGGTATIQVRARVDPVPRPEPERAPAAPHAAPPQRPASAEPGPSRHPSPAVPAPDHDASRSGKTVIQRTGERRIKRRRRILIVVGGALGLTALIVILSMVLWSPDNPYLSPTLSPVFSAVTTGGATEKLSVKVTVSAVNVAGPSLSESPVKVLRNGTQHSVASGRLSAALKFSADVPAGQYQVCLDAPVGWASANSGTHVVAGFICITADLTKSPQTVTFHLQPVTTAPSSTS